MQGGTCWDKSWTLTKPLLMHKSCQRSCISMGGTASQAGHELGELSPPALSSKVWWWLQPSTRLMLSSLGVLSPWEHIHLSPWHPWTCSSNPWGPEWAAHTHSSLPDTYLQLCPEGPRLQALGQSPLLSPRLSPPSAQATAAVSFSPPLLGLSPLVLGFPGLTPSSTF